LNRKGNLSFGLSSSGELIRLYNEQGVLVDSVHYLSQAPWPTAPNGNGPTLELIHPSLDNALPQSWAASSGFGTPGSSNSTITGIPEIVSLETGSTLTIHPNPVQDVAYIVIHGNLDAEGEVVITDPAGREVHRLKHITSGQVSLDTRHLTPGIYICRFIGKTSLPGAVQKMIVK
jgi:hypothetical protein